MKQQNLTPKKKEFTRRTVQIFSRHPSHAPLRRSIFHPKRALVRFGSTTVPALQYDVEINTPQAVRNSASKLLMKQCFTQQKVSTPEWGELSKVKEVTNEGVKTDILIPFPIVIKHIFGSRGRGNYKIDSREQYNEWIKGKTLNNYIFEKFYNYSREYRLHINAMGCYYPCRKMLKNEIPGEKRWYRNDSNCVWIVEQNPQFQKPANWQAIVDESIKALKAVGLDFGAVDVRVQGKDKNGQERKTPEFTIIEINSAPGLGEKVGLEVYRNMIPKLIDYKLANK